MRKLVSETANVPKVRLGRVAIIAPGPVQYGLSRMYETLSNELGIHDKFHVFSDFSEARTWLGLPKDVELHP